MCNICGTHSVSHPLARSKTQRLCHGQSICVTYVSHPLARYVDGRKFVDEIFVTYVSFSHMSMRETLCIRLCVYACVKSYRVAGTLCMRPNVCVCVCVCVCV